MKALAVDLALRSGWAYGEWLLLPLEFSVKDGTLGIVGCQTRVRVLETGILTFEPQTAATLQEQGERLYHGRLALFNLLRGFPAVDVLGFESAMTSSWFRRLPRTGTAFATTGAVRGALLDAAHEAGVKEVLEVEPQTWQQATLGGKRLKRDALKKAAKRACLWRLGIVAEDEDLADAILLLEYVLTLRNKGVG